MKNLHNIEPSAFRRGEYVGYAGGVWLIRKTNSTYGNWIARHRDNIKEPAIYAFTLASLSRKLDIVAKCDTLKAQSERDLAQFVADGLGENTDFCPSDNN